MEASEASLTPFITSVRALMPSFALSVWPILLLVDSLLKSLAQRFSSWQMARPWNRLPLLLVILPSPLLAHTLLFFMFSFVFFPPSMFDGVWHRQ